MSPAWLNRLILVFGAIGIFIAGTLTYTHFADIVVPCTENAQCERVLTSEYAAFGSIPVALFGLLAYVALSALAVARALKPDLWQNTMKIGFGISILGGLGSFYFMYVAFGVLQARCDWCISSAVIMTLLMVIHAALWTQSSGKLDISADGLAPKILAVALPVALVGIGISVAQMNPGPEEVGAEATGGRAVALDAVLPDDYKVMGSDSARVTIVEFADLNCPACRRSFGLLKQEMDRNPNEIRIAFRHFPLRGPGFETSIMAAVAAEFAAEQGLFWEFMTLAMDESNDARIRSFEGILSMARELGMDAEALDSVIRNSGDYPFLQRVRLDQEAGLRINVQGTPTYFVFAEGQPTLMVNANQLSSVIDRAVSRLR